MIRYQTLINLLFIASLIGPCSYGQQAAARPNKLHDPTRTEALTIVVRPDGFGQSSLRVPAGRYSVSIFNRSGIDDLPIQFDRMAGESSSVVSQGVRDGKADEKTSRFVERLVLSKGSYRISIRNRPKWVLRIEVD